MNEEAFQNTLKTGKMTYWSRSRQELWLKGLTSGHFQYVKSLALDCDNDTILAKVDQIGAACHTGSRSCFFKPLVQKEYNDTNPLHIFQDVYDVIADRCLLYTSNITLNGRKATGNEKLNTGDQIRLFLSDETFSKFSQQEQTARAVTDLDIIYEDTDILLINKPAGMLSQPDDTKEPSMVEYLSLIHISMYSMTSKKTD